MRKFEFYIIVAWLLFRMLFHSIDFSDSIPEGETIVEVEIVESFGSRLLSYLYFAGTNFAILGFFTILRNVWQRSTFRIPYMSKKQGNRFTKFLIIFSTWCLIIDHLLLFGLGAHDSIFYTISCIGVITIGALWVKSA